MKEYQEYFLCMRSRTGKHILSAAAPGYVFFNLHQLEWCQHVGYSGSEAMARHVCINLCIQVRRVKSSGLQQPNSGFTWKLGLPGQNLYPSTIHLFMPLIVSAQIDLPLLKLLFPCKLIFSKFDFLSLSHSPPSPPVRQQMRFVSNWGLISHLAVRQI